MRAEIACHQRVHHLAADEVSVHVLLLINRFQFALEKAEDGVDQAFAVDLRPLDHILRGKRIEIECGVVRGRRVQPGTAEPADEPVELVGNDIFGRADAQLVDLLLQAGACFGIFRHGQFVVFHGDGIQQDFLRLVVERPDAFRPLKHHMLEIVGDPCARTVLRSCFHDDGAENLRLAVIFVQPNGQSVFQSIFFYFESVQVLCLRLIRTTCKCHHH